MKEIQYKSNEHYYPLAVSYCGKVKNLETDNVLKTPIGSHGYPIISGRLGGIRRCLCVHRLVGEILIPNPHNLPVINHLDSDRTNNSVVNLEWTTYAGNSQHAAANNRFMFNGVSGEGSNLAIYSDETIHEICCSIREGMRNVDIARKFNIPSSYIKELKAKKSRRDVTELYDFPLFKRQSVSTDTVEWICKLIVEGISYDEIISLSDNSNITKNLLKNIKRKGSYKSISDLYF